MNTKQNRSVLLLAVILSAICAVSIFLLYYFEQNIGGRLLYLAIASGVFCVLLIHILILNVEILIQQPFSGYMIAGMYLLVSLLICFPNRIVDSVGALYIIAIPVSVYFGFRYGLVTVLNLLVIVILGYGWDGSIEIQHISYTLVVCAVAAGKKSKRLDLLAALFVAVLQFVLLFSGTNKSHLIYETVIICMNAVMIPIVHRVAGLREQFNENTEELLQESMLADDTEDVADAFITDSNSADKHDVPDLSKCPYALSYLSSDECEILQYLQTNAPKSFARAKEVADFARTMALKFGANSELVYCAAIYHDIERLYKQVPGASVILPDVLYRMIQKQNKKEAPGTIEELIVLLSNHVITIYHYMLKNGTNIAVEKVIDSIFNLQLKKGNIMTMGISMSLYHKIKQEFINEFIGFIKDKQEERGNT